MVSDANVTLWGMRVGGVSWDNRRRVGVFQYDPAFVGSATEISPRKMPLRFEPYTFLHTDLDDRETFMGLPGLLAETLPDAFGNALISAWLAETGRAESEFSPVDRLCCIGRRGMGALEFEPPLTADDDPSRRVEVEQLLDLANRALARHAGLVGRMGVDEDEADLNDILRVGVSAGGARAKAVLAWNPLTNEFHSGQLDADRGFEHWLLKFDGASGQTELAEPQGYGKIEYAYYLMAEAAGISMAECRLHHEGGRSHFMTRRFDRDKQGGKVHMQSLWALEHFHYSVPPRHAYEQAVGTIRGLGMGMDDVEEQFRRAVFNVMSRNQDDHVKNISFLMDKQGAWHLAPAYDVAYAYNPSDTAWTNQHQMSLAGKHDGFEADDLFQFAQNISLKPARARECIDQIFEAVSQWLDFAEKARVSPEKAERIKGLMRLSLVSGTCR